jgi:hypothetical protein
MSDIPLPPASFEFLVFSLKMQAEMRMGLLGFGDQDEAPDLGAARHAIDLLAMLSEKTRGNLSLEEQRMTENSLTELRFRYVQAVEDAAKAKAESPAETPGEPEPGATEASA